MRRLLLIGAQVMALALIGALSQAATTSKSLAILVSGTSAACPQGNSYPDGCAGAPTPAGGIEYSGELSTYGAHRPPWNVAGIDYYVGQPTGQTLTDWNATFMTGACSTSCSVGGATWQVPVSGDLAGQLVCLSGNPVLDRYDFTTGTIPANGIYFAPGSCTGLTITNSKFGCQSGGGGGAGGGGFNLQSAMPNGLTFEDNTVNFAACPTADSGGGGGSAWFTLCCASIPTITLEYNYIEHLAPQVISIYNDGGTITSLLYRYNLLHNAASSDGAPSDHMNILQWGGTGTVSGVNVSYNAVWFDFSDAGGEGFQFYLNGGNSGPWASPNFSNNTFPNSGCDCISHMVNAGGPTATYPTTVTSGTDDDNYFDPTNYVPYYPGTMTPGTTGWSSAGNINMTNGATITPP